MAKKLKIKRIVGGNTKKLTINPGARSNIKESQKSQLKDYKYDLQAKVRQDISGPKVGAVASRGRLSSFKITPRNTSITAPAIRAKGVGVGKKKKTVKKKTK
jgi:hypothetical protein